MGKKGKGSTTETEHDSGKETDSVCSVKKEGKETSINKDQVACICSFFFSFSRVSNNEKEGKKNTDTFFFLFFSFSL